MKIKNNQLIIEQRFDLTGDFDLRGTGITSLPDNLSVGRSIYKDFN